MSPMAILLVASMGLTAAGAISSYQQDKENARQARKTGEANAARIARDRRKRIGFASAKYAGLGVTIDGSPADVLNEMVEEAALDRRFALSTGSNRARQFRARATSSLIQGGASILGTASQGFETGIFGGGGGGGGGGEGGGGTPPT